MHKGIDNYKNNCYYLDDIKKAEEEHRTVFLDIDGVLQPTSYERRHDHNNEYLKKYLYEKYNDERFLKMDPSDIGAVYYDWRPLSVGILKEILDETRSHIVLESNWRYGHSWDELKAFFKVYDMEDYLIDRTPFTEPHNTISHEDSVKLYLSSHPEIKKYIVLDDIDYYDIFGENFRKIKNNYGSLTTSDLEYARLVLNGNPVINIEDEYITFGESIQLHYKIFESNGFKFFYIDSVWNKYHSLNIDTELSYILAYIYKRYPEIDEFFLYDERLNINKLGIGYKDSLGTYSISRDFDRDNTKYYVKRKILKEGLN